MKTRRSFIQKSLAFGGAISLGAFDLKAKSNSISEALLSINETPLNEAVSNEKLWASIQQAYTTSNNLINLNNGGVSPQPLVVQNALERYNKLSNEAPSYYMWRILDKDREALRRKLADLAGCYAETIAINRNATEGLATAILSVPLQKGDEIILSKFDYPAVINTWKQRQERDGIVIKWVDLKLPSENASELINAYTSAFTKKTKVVQLTHMINWTGQVLPVKEICNSAREQGITSIIDGAHSFAHLDFKIDELGCDYFATSLHKWLCAPFGTGLLYVRKELIDKTWAIFPGENPTSSDIRKFEHLGTRSFPSEMAIGTAINFHEAIGSELKTARLFYLKKYWTDQVKDLPIIQFYSPLSSEFSGAICHFGIDEMEGLEIDKYLFKNYRIHCVAMKHNGINGVRIAPNLYTRTKDLDVLVSAIQHLVK